MIRYISAIVCFLVIATDAAAQRKIPRRAESFFGLHFDFHASVNDTMIGQYLTEQFVDSLLTAVQPDFIQVDAKGHPGVNSYPSKVEGATTVKSFYTDPLALFRKVTKKHGVALYVHYSGVWDDAILVKHPDWAVMNAEGKLSKQKISFFSRYADEHLIPQLKEIADYGIDGVWVDGDCWAAEPDYGKQSFEAFTKSSGFKTLPVKSTDSGYFEFMRFNRSLFKNYVAHYVDALHQYKPSFQVASNWAFSSLMPEPAKINVDFMSGDLTPMNGVNSALFEARVLATQSRIYKKPWDLMSWSFNTEYNTDHHVPKTAVNLSQEAAEVIATGGGYQCYFTQKRDGSIRPQDLGTMKQLAQFVRARQPFTQGATAVPQIGLLYSFASYEKMNRSLYGNQPAAALRGVLTALMDAQYAVEVLTEDHFKGSLKNYPLIVIPEFKFLEESFINELLNYVSEGGSLLVIGADAVKPFAAPLKISMKEESSARAFYISTKNEMAFVNDKVAAISIDAAAKSIGGIYNNNDIRFQSGVPASVTSYGKGKIGGIYFDYGKSYSNYQTPQLRDFLHTVVKELFAEPLVEAKGSKLLHITVNRLRGKMAINLVNSSGNYNSNKVATYDEIPALHDLELRIRLKQKPSKIILQPENKSLPFTYNNGVTVVKVPKVEIHSVLMVD